MDSVQQFDFQHASACKPPYVNYQHVSPQSTSDSESQFSIDSVSSQDSAASSATSASTLWSSANSSQVDLSLINQSRVEQWTREAWSHGWNHPQHGQGQGFQAPPSAAFLGDRRRTSSSLEDREGIYSNHRQELRAINEQQPSTYPCPAAVRAARARAQSLSACGTQYCSKAQALPPTNNGSDRLKTSTSVPAFRGHASHFEQQVSSISDLSGGALFSSSSNPVAQNKTCQQAPEPNFCHPRRSSTVASWTKPTLVRQTERRQALVEHLVGKQQFFALTHGLWIASSSLYLHILNHQDSASQLVGAIWPTSMPVGDDRRNSHGCPIIPLRDFIRETLKRSRTSYSTLQLTLYYLLILRIKGNLPSCDFTKEQTEDAPHFRSLQCGRRMFLAALILASKYLQDQNYSAKAWSKITGLKVQEISSNEMAFLAAVDFALHIKGEVYEAWVNIVTRCTDAPTTAHKSQRESWLNVIDMFGRQVPIHQISKSVGLKSSSHEDNATSAPVDVHTPANVTQFNFPKYPSQSSSAPDSEMTGQPFAVPNRFNGEQSSQTFAVPPAPTLGGPLQTPQISPCNSRRNSVTPASSCGGNLSRVASWDLASNCSSDDGICPKALNKTAAFSRWVNSCQNTPFMQHTRPRPTLHRVDTGFGNLTRMVSSPESIASSCESLPGTQQMNMGSTVTAPGLLTPTTSVSGLSNESADIRIPETPALDSLAIQDSVRSTPSQIFVTPTKATSGPAVSGRPYGATYLEHEQRQFGLPTSKPATPSQPIRPTIGPHSRSSHDLFQNVRGLLNREVRSTASVQQAAQSETKQFCGPAEPQVDTEFMNYIENLMHPTPVSNIRDADRTPLGTPTGATVQSSRKRGCDEVEGPVERQEKLRCMVKA